MNRGVVNCLCKFKLNPNYCIYFTPYIEKNANNRGKRVRRPENQAPKSGKVLERRGRRGGAWTCLLIEVRDNENRAPVVIKR